MTVDKYPLQPAFERVVAYYAATSIRFMSMVGHAVDPEGLSLPAARYLVENARAVFHERGTAASAVITLQRMRRLVGEGKLRHEDLVDAADLIDVEEVNPKRPDEDEVAAELVPVLRRRIQEAAALAAQDDYANDSDFGATTKLVEAACRLGNVDESTGVKLGDGSSDLIRDLARAERLPIGVPEVDLRIRGGLRKGTFGIFLGGTGDGKSMALGHVAASTYRMGLFVAYATLEVIPADVLARVMANLAGIPIDAVIEDPGPADARIRALAGDGLFRVHEFEPIVTTFADVAAWVKKIEDREGREVDLLVTDYGDKLGDRLPKGKRGSDSDSSYRMGLAVYESMRTWTKREQKWHWTASQATRRKDKRKLLTVDDTADSMHKARVGELIISLNVDAERQITFHGAKNRQGVAGFNIGPMPTDFEFGRLTTVNQEDP